MNKSLENAFVESDGPGRPLLAIPRLMRTSDLGSSETQANQTWPSTTWSVGIKQ